MKKIVFVVFSVLLILSFVACGTNKTPNDANPSARPENSSTPESDFSTPSSTNGVNETPSEKPTGGKVLVVYYSASGNTETVAGYIASATNADLFELVPVNPYTSDDLNWTNQNSRVSREHNDVSLRTVELVKSVPDNWDDYDTIFIGYPIWWGIAAWPVDGFISANDFTGKTVIPFCTSASSGLGQSGQLLADAAGNGNWLAGHRFTSRPSEQSVREWVDSLGLN